MLADPRNGKAVRRLMRSDRRYRQLMERMADHWRKAGNNPAQGSSETASSPR